MIAANLTRVFAAMELPEPPELLPGDAMTLRIMAEARELTNGDVLRILDEWGIYDKEARRIVRRGCLAVARGYHEAEVWHQIRKE